MTWTPVLQGEQASRAQSWLEGIAEALRKLPLGDPTRPAYSMDGAAAEALFFAYLDKAWPGSGWGSLVDERLEEAIGALSSARVQPALYGGFCGTAWVVEHLQRLGMDVASSDDDVNADIDQVLVSLIEQRPWEGHYDLISGLCGFSVYAAQRLARTSGRRVFSAIVDALANNARPMRVGYSWWTSPQLLPEYQRERNPEGYYNLGLAHGVPAVLWTLSRACEQGIGSRTRDLGNGLVDWLLSQCVEEPHHSAFPSWVSASAPTVGATMPSRAAWCYGDPGTLIALQNGALTFARNDCSAAILDLAKRAAMRSIRASNLVDGGLCHGSGGLALIWNRFWHNTGDSVFEEASRRCYAHLLDQRVEENGTGGVRAYRRGESIYRPKWVPDASLLTGATGIGLALIAGLSAVEPGWDTVLMTNLPLKA